MPTDDPNPARRRRPRGLSPQELAQRAVDRARSLAGTPEIAAAPDGVGLTGLPSYVWLEERPRTISATATAGGLSVTAQATPVEFTWSFGDGEDAVTSSSGRAWTRRKAGTISHTYETRGFYELNIDVLWEARWRLGAGAWQPLGYFTTSGGRDYPVRQVVAVLTQPR